GVLAAVIRARATGEPTRLEIAQSDAAAAMDWLRSETWRGHQRPQGEGTRHPPGNQPPGAPGAARKAGGGRVPLAETKDGHILFQASEREFWENYCRGIDRADLFDQNPGSQYADHAVGNLELRKELRDIFLSRTSAEWVQLGERVNTPIVNVNTPKTIA